MMNHQVASAGELQQQIEDIGAALRRAGFGRKSRIAVAMPNGPQAALAIVAVSCSSACAPINPRQTVHEIARYLAALRPQAVLLMKEGESAARQAAEASGVVVIEAVQRNEGALGFDIVVPKSDTAT